jgi:hypothetical protein
MADNNGITPDYIVFNQEGDILIAGPAGIPGAMPRGRGLSVGPAGTVLGSDGLDPVWLPYNLNPGSVTSVSVTGSSGLTVTGSPITSNGTINISLSNPTLLPNAGNISGHIDLASGTFNLSSSITGGTVTSIGITSASLTVSGTNPVLTSGIIDIELPIQNISWGAGATFQVPTITVNSNGIITAISSGTVATNQLSGILQAAQFPALTGDITTTAGSLATTLATVNSSIGTFGDSSHVGSFVVNAKGLITSASNILITPSSIGALPISGGTITGALIISGDLTVNGTTTTIDSETLNVTDINITMGNVVTPTDATASGGGIELLGTTTKSIIWLNDGNNSWTSNVNFNLNSGLAYKINNANVLNATTLGSSVVNSSLTSVGTIVSGTWEGAIIQPSYISILNQNTTGQAGTVATISGLITNGSNITITGSGTSVSPYSISATAGGTVTSITAGTGLSGGTITTSGTISVSTNGITNSLFRQSAALSVVGNSGSSTANVADITTASPNQILASNSLSSALTWQSLSTLLDNTFGSSRGDLLYRSNSGWAILAPSTAGDVLTTQGGAADPIWSPTSGSGTVGAGATTDIAVYTGTTAVAGSSGFTYSSGVLSLPTGSGHGIAIGTQTLFWQPNNDTTSIAVGAGQSANKGSLGGMTGTNQSNVALGNLAGNSITSGAQSVAIGTNAMQGVGFGAITGNNNIAIGFQSMNIAQGTAANNVCLGTQTGASITTGTNNTMLGTQVGQSTLTTGTYNLLIGCSNSVVVPSATSVNYLAIGLAMDGTTGENSNTAKAGIRSLGYIAEKNYTIITTGIASTVSNACSTVIFNPATAIATYTLTFPTAPVDGQILKISASAGTGVTALTLTSGGTINSPITTLIGGTNTPVAYIYNLSGTTWFPTI